MSFQQTLDELGQELFNAYDNLALQVFEKVIALGSSQDPPPTVELRSHYDKVIVARDTAVKVLQNVLPVARKIDNHKHEEIALEDLHSMQNFSLVFQDNPKKITDFSRFQAYHAAKQCGIDLESPEIKKISEAFAKITFQGQRFDKIIESLYKSMIGTSIQGGSLGSQEESKKNGGDVQDGNNIGNILHWKGKDGR